MTSRTRPARDRRRSRQRGFTLIELSVVIIILSIVTTIALANFIRFQHRASYTSCVSNQRHVLEAATLYASLVNPGSVAFDVNILTAGGYLTTDAAECPRSTVHALNDYHVWVVNNRVTQIQCLVLPVDHTWNVP